MTSLPVRTRIVQHLVQKCSGLYSHNGMAWTAGQAEDSRPGSAGDAQRGTEPGAGPEPSSIISRPPPLPHAHQNVLEEKSSQNPLVMSSEGFLQNRIGPEIPLTRLEGDGCSRPASTPCSWRFWTRDERKCFLSSETPDPTIRCSHSSRLQKTADSITTQSSGPLHGNQNSPAAGGSFTQQCGLDQNQNQNQTMDVMKS